MEGGFPGAEAGGEAGQKISECFFWMCERGGLSYVRAGDQMGAFEEGDCGFVLRVYVVGLWGGGREAGECDVGFLLDGLRF